MAVESSDGWVIDFAGWKQKDKTALLKVEQEAQKDGDETRMYPFFARAVKRWPYELDPADPSSYGELDLRVYQEVVKRIREALKSYLTQSVS